MFDYSQERFAAFFRAIHGRDPYDWQHRLAERAATGEWPDAIDLPTGSGKTACLDVAVFAMACQSVLPAAEQTAPRRIFFCVNRRVIVDEACQRARKIAKALWDAEADDSGNSRILAEAAAGLRLLAGENGGDASPPLDVLELRGGIYRDNRWARSAAQPTIVCTTVDQLGSRLLFRGYGVSPNAAPIQAALIAYDSLILLDEAHISTPFCDTLDRVRNYLDAKRWAEEEIGRRPMRFIPMTATPSGSATDVIRLSDLDRASTSLMRRLAASKPAELLVVKDVGKDLAKRASSLAKAAPAAIGVIVNRVATARQIFQSLTNDLPDMPIELVIGAMRPIDRDAQSGSLRTRVGPDRPDVTAESSITVATQCLEVGADYDFDILLTECASIDALRQRFGRLNRAGRPIDARAVIAIKEKDAKAENQLDEEKPLDPIYGNALARTWNLLFEHATVIGAVKSAENGEEPFKAAAASETGPRQVDFGIDAFSAFLIEHAPGEKLKELLAPSANMNAPVMLPAYVDLWCQTAPVPSPDPDVALFLHGEQRREPDVQVCWRADLGDDLDLWSEIVGMVPPSSAECISVPISRVRDWLGEREKSSDNYADVLEAAPPPDDDDRANDRADRVGIVKRTGLLWRGPKLSKILQAPSELRRGDTLVLPVATEGWKALGHIPQGGTQEIDVADVAFRRARDRYVLRINQSLPGAAAAYKDILGRFAQGEDRPTNAELRDLLRDVLESTPDGDPVRETIRALRNSPFIREDYPDGRGTVLKSRRRIRAAQSWYLPSLDDSDDDDLSRINREKPVSLDDHTGHVATLLAQIVALLPTKVGNALFQTAARLHDWGKADPRFQALLRGAGLTDSWLFTGRAPQLLAKSAPQSWRERQAARARSDLPAGFRHEMLSVLLAERASDHLPPDQDVRDLALHLIAAHHGHARPFAPVVVDTHPPEIEYSGVHLSASNRLENPPHRLDSGIADRFWTLSRRYGWWGLAYLETLLRLADQQASENEDAVLDTDDTPTPETEEVTV